VKKPTGKMMEEISIMVAYDAHVFSQLHDEDFLTSLVATSKPRSMVGGTLHTTLAFSFCNIMGTFHSKRGVGSCEVNGSTAADCTTGHSEVCRLSVGLFNKQTLFYVGNML
jgi:hypothetical protein